VSSTGSGAWDKRTGGSAGHGAHGHADSVPSGLTATCGGLRSFRAPPPRSARTGGRRCAIHGGVADWAAYFRREVTGQPWRTMVATWRPLPTGDPGRPLRLGAGRAAHSRIRRGDQVLAGRPGRCYRHQIPVLRARQRHHARALGDRSNRCPAHSGRAYRPPDPPAGPQAAEVVVARAGRRRTDRTEQGPWTRSVPASVCVGVAARPCGG
jgi:hypothetical protein